MEKFPKVAIIYLSYHSEPYLEDVVESLKKISYPKNQVEFVIVDNPHPEFGLSNKYIEQYILPLSEKELPHITYLPQLENKGFCGGMNVGLEWVITRDFKYAYLHNQDGYMEHNALQKIVAACEENLEIGAAQSLMLLKKNPSLINSSGNIFHYLGFGYVGDYKKNRNYISLKKIDDIGYASGGAILLRTDLLKKYGLKDEDYTSYHEDIEYSMRLRSVGYRVVAISDSIFYHDYEFGRNKDKFYFMERNRFGLLLTYYKFFTLLLFFPIGIVIEFGILFFALTQGWLKQKIKADVYWFRASSIKKWWKKRSNIQKNRKKADGFFLQFASAKIFFPEAGMNNPLLKYIANPLMIIYFFLIRKLIR